MPDRPNYYELLDLDPSVRDWKKIKQVIAKKRKRWMNAQTQLNETLKKKAELGLKHLEQMERVLADLDQCSLEAERRQAELDAEHERKEQGLVRWIEKLKREGGTCDRQRFERLTKKFADLFSPEEILSRLQEEGIQIVEDGDSTDPSGVTKEFTDHQRVDGITSKLEKLGESDLYSFLGTHAGMSARDLLKRADERLKESNRLAKTGDEHFDAKRELEKICLAVFETEEEKERYDNYLRIRPMVVLHDEIKYYEMDKEIQRVDLDRLVEEALELGVERSDASAYLRWYIQQRGWKIQKLSAEEMARRMAAAEAKAAAEAMAEELRREQAEREAREGAEKTGKERRQAQQKPSQGSADEQHAPRETRSAADPPQAETAADESAPPRATPRQAPLPAPGALRVIPIDGGFSLTWRPAVFDGSVRYRVLRKSGNAPWDEGDGHVVGSEVGGTRLDDSGVSGGRDWYYAVFSVWNGEVSEEAAVSGPHQLRSPGFRKLFAAAALLALLIGGAYAATLLDLGGGGNQPTRGSSQVATPPPGTGDPPLGYPKPPEEPTRTPPMSKVAAHGTTPGSAQLPVPKPAPLPLPSPLPPVPQPPPKPRPAPPPPKPIPVPADPRVTVVATGDPQLTSTVENQLAQILRDRGLEVVSRSQLLRTDAWIRRSGGRTDAYDLLPLLEQDGVHVLVLARVDHLGERELSYLGRRDVATSSSLSVDAFLVAAERGLGATWSESLEYTAVNRNTKVESAILDMSTGIARAVRDGWSGYRQSLGL